MSAEELIKQALYYYFDEGQATKDESVEDPLMGYSI